MSIALSILRTVYHNAVSDYTELCFFSVVVMHQHLALGYIDICYMKLHISIHSGTRMLVWMVR